MNDIIVNRKNFGKNIRSEEMTHARLENVFVNYGYIIFGDR